MKARLLKVNALARALAPGRARQSVRACSLAFALVCACACAARAQGGDAKLRFWDAQRKGANNFNLAPRREWWAEARAAGIELVRLAPSRWKSARKDFLIGDADSYEGLVEEDFAKLRAELDAAHAAGVRVVLTTLTLPGARYRQSNGGRPDFRLWREPRFLAQAARFWRDLAGRLKDHPAVVGYNLLNEPTPERAAGLDSPAEVTPEWLARAEGTPADLNRFNEELLRAVRAADPATPVVIDAGWWANAAAFRYLKPLADARVLYSLHVYDPYDYTNRQRNDGRYSYPGRVVLSRGEEAVGGAARGESAVELNREALERIVRPVAEWQERHGVASARIFVGEFGCNRMNGGAAGYLGDLVRIFNARGWHWAFFTFRADDWTGMDYELGATPPGAAYWSAVERGERPQLKRVDNPIWEVFRREFKK
jgi:endoglucanase